MDDQLFKGRAKRLIRQDFEKRVAESSVISDARREADRIIAAAKAEADRVKAEVDAAWEAHESKMRSLADDQLMTFVDASRIEKSAKAFVDLLSTSRKVQSDFDDMSPWLHDVILTAVRQIIGDLPATERWQAVLGEALKSVRDRWDLTVRCHPGAVATIETLLAKDSEFFKSIQEVQADPGLAEEACLLVGANGILDLGVETQLQSLSEAISSAMQSARKA